MSHKLLIFIVALQIATPLFSQFEFPPMGGASAALGGVSAALPDEESALYNIAGVAWNDKGIVSLSVRQNHFAEGLGYAAAGMSVPLGTGGVLASFTHHGNSDYNEQIASVGYAMPLGKSVVLGAAFHYLHSGTSDAYYDPLNRVTFSIALQYGNPTGLLVGFKAYNPIAVVSDVTSSLRVPAIFNLGVSYRVMPELLAVVETEKNLYYSPTLKVGLAYTFHEDYIFRLGLNTQPVFYTFGFGYHRDHFGANIAMQVHNILGITPQLSLQYLF